MASESISTRSSDPDHKVRTLLPLALLAVFSIVVVLSVISGVRHAVGAEISDTQEKHFVFRRLEDPLYLGTSYALWRGLLTAALLLACGALSARFFFAFRATLREGGHYRLMVGVYLTIFSCLIYLILTLWLLLLPGGSGRLWLHVLIPVLIAALLYVAWMYVRDSAGVGWPWATFLAALRSTVYAILAVVFLLPAWQTWEKSETHSKAVMLADVSGSMASRDDLPTDALPPEKLPSRQDKVIRFLGDGQIGFLKHIQEKNPIALYRFGSLLDEQSLILDKGKLLSEEEWNAWLKPLAREAIPDSATEEEKAKLRKRQELHQQLVNGTHLGDVLQATVNRESNNMVQGLILFSDGRSTQYSAQVFEELRARAHKAKLPIFAVAVGEHRQPINIRITDLQAPEQARPEDRFPVRVEVDGDGLPDRETTVYLEVTNPKGEKQKLEQKVKFSPGSGGPPHAQAEFEIDAAKFGVIPAGGTTPELEEGEWSFVARVPRDKREVFVDKEHVSDKAPVQVVKKPLRVLLFSGVATRDFQFIRNLLVREVDKRRAELSVCLQMQREGVVQDVPADRLLRQFPYRFQAEDDGQEKAEEKYYNLAQYDLIVAIDPDWSLVPPEQLALLEKWVGTHAGGLIVVAGPVNTYQLARPGNRDKLKPLLELFPVILQDSRLAGLALDRSTTEPWRLNFPGATAEMEFLKLQDEGKDPLAGWEEFFTGKPKGEGNRDALQRGFYNYYPVESVKPSASVIATFTDPRALSSGQEQPFLVTMPYGNGKVVYLGSDTTWRLRMYREIFHERFWTKLGRFAGSGNLTRLSRRGVLVMGREFSAGHFVRLEAQLFGRDLQPLARTLLPKIMLRPPTGVTMPTTVEMQPKPSQGGAWAGWFQARFLVTNPGEYRLDLQIPDTGDLLPGRFLVKEANPELDNTRPDFAQLYQLASAAGEVLPRIKDKQAQNEFLQVLEATSARLLQPAEDLPGQPRQSTGRETTGRERETPRLFFDLSTAKLIPGCLVADSKIQKNRGPYQDLWDRGVILKEQGLFGSETPIEISYILMTVVVLLSVEWLTRKLLRLA